MQKYMIVDKQIGRTPLQELEALKSAHSELSAVPLTYAGRLDPMASGKLLVLIGDECKKRAEYDVLDKQYDFEILLGVATDTGDVLGLASACGVLPLPSDKDISNALRMFVGRTSVSYPAFSSKTVNGKPLFEYALAGALDTITVPTTDSRVYKIALCNVRQEGGQKIIDTITSRIALLNTKGNKGTVSPDFRREQALASWKEAIKLEAQYTILTCTAVVSSGTYIRTLAENVAKKLGTCGLAYSIHRSQIGKYVPLVGTWGFWRKRY